MHSAVRLLDGGARPEDPGRRLAGVEIRMTEHFKTYWRRRATAACRRSSAERLAEPAERGGGLARAHRFEDSAGASIGYKEHLVLPLLVTPENPRLPVKLVLALDYAVCEQVCIPARGEMRLELAASAMSAPQAR